MSVHPTVTAQPAALSSQPLSMQKNQWSNDICDCCQDMGICCFGYWCPWCLACKTAHDFGECLCLPLLDSCCLVPPILLSLRSVMRERYRIQGTICNDCILSVCCSWCAWCQMAHELKKRRSPVILAVPPPTCPAPYPLLPTQPPPAGLYPKAP